MGKQIIWLLALFVVGAPTGAVAGDAPTDSLHAGAGRFQIDSGDSKILVGRSRTKAYHVCMAAGPMAGPLKVKHNGKETIVQPGECQLVEASNIKLAAVGKLDRGMILMGRRTGNLSMETLKKYSTEVTARVSTAVPDQPETVARVDP